MRHPFVTIGAVLILLFLCVGAWYFTTVRDFRVDIAVHDISSQDYTGAINILQKVVNKDDGSKRIAGVYGLL